jgi:hypothetical protein
MAVPGGAGGAGGGLGSAGRRPIAGPHRRFGRPPARLRRALPYARRDAVAVTGVTGASTVAGRRSDISGVASVTPPGWCANWAG